MTLGIFLPVGGSLRDQEKNGKFARLRDYYLPEYLSRFEKVYIFSYENEKRNDLPENCYLVTNKNNLHRYLYAFLLPIIHWRIISSINLIRVMQFDGIVPAITSKVFFGKKISVTYGYDYKKVSRVNQNYFSWLIYFLLEVIFLPLADSVIFSSLTIQKMFPKVIKKSVYLPNGIDLSEFKPEPNASSKEHNLFTQGRLVAEKNLDLLIRAAAIVKDKKITVTIIGDGPLKLQLEDLAKNLEVNLQIITKVPNNQISKYFNHAALFVYPSITEGSPKALLEAAGCGCCILASDIPQIREILGDNGGEYFKLNEDDLVSKIKYLLEDPDKRKKYQMAARDIAETRFDLKKLLKKETEILFNLANNG